MKFYKAVGLPAVAFYRCYGSLSMFSDVLEFTSLDRWIYTFHHVLIEVTFTEQTTGLFSPQDKCGLRGILAIQS